MYLTGLTNGVCQTYQPVTCPRSDLQHSLAVEEPEWPDTEVTDCMFARIGNEVGRGADPIIETSRLVPFGSSFPHDRSK